jgi:membrane protease YdiL (CAAX protease family)
MCWLPVVAADYRVGSFPPSAAPLLIVLGTFGPFLAALTLVSRSSGFAGVRGFLSQAFRWRVGIQWYAAALVAPAAIRLAVLYVHVLRGGTVPDLDETSRWLAVPATFLWVLLLGGPTGEEFGWRGYLLQRLQLRWGVLWASLVIGIVTAVWHLPLFFIAGTSQSHLPFALFAGRTVALSIISTWLYNGSRRSLLLVLLFHASLNTWPNTLYVLEADGALGPYISTTIIYAGWAAALGIFGLLRGRGELHESADAVPSMAA